MNWHSCLSVDPRDANDYTSFQDEEAQIRAVFKEALRLKKRVRDLSRELANSQNNCQQVSQELAALLREKEIALEHAQQNLMQQEERHAEQLRKETQALSGQLEHARYELSKQDPFLVSMKTKIQVLENAFNELTKQAEQEKEAWSRTQVQQKLEEDRIHEQLQQYVQDLNREREKVTELQHKFVAKEREVQMLRDTLNRSPCSVDNSQPTSDSGRIVAQMTLFIQSHQQVQKAVQDVILENSRLQEMLRRSPEHAHVMQPRSDSLHQNHSPTYSVRNHKDTMMTDTIDHMALEIVAESKRLTLHGPAAGRAAAKQRRLQVGLMQTDHSYSAAAVASTSASKILVGNINSPLVLAQERDFDTSSPCKSDTSKRPGSDTESSIMDVVPRVKSDMPAALPSLRKTHLYQSRISVK